MACAVTSVLSRKGIVLAGGAGSRLYPATNTISKQLLPVYDKPMIYYPLTTLMLAGIRDILLISTPSDIGRFEQLLGNGNQWGIQLTYAIQSAPKGIAQAFIIAREFIGNDYCALILGDNIFYGHELDALLNSAFSSSSGATIFAYHVHEPERYGVVEFDSQRQAVSIVEKPQIPKSHYAVTGLYFYDQQVCDIADTLHPSIRGELEISDINRTYLKQKNLHVEVMGRGFAWLDTGTHDSLLDASQYIATLEKRQGLKVACPEEIAFRKGYIDAEQLEKLASALKQNAYGQYLRRVLQDKVY
jgi:glucose-1-phosphate thymidylyltransferase